MARDFSLPPVIFNVSTPTYRRHPILETDPSEDPMARDFPLPPVVFNVSTPTYRRHPIPETVPFEQPESTLLMDERPLLEELDIDMRLVWRKTLSILHPLRSADPSLHADADLSGPFLFVLSFGLFQLLAGKLHFGIALGWVTVASLFLYFVFSELSGGRRGDLDLYRCASLVGYGMLPIVIFSAVSLFLPRGGWVIFAVAMGFVLWSTRVCTTLLASGAGEHRGLVAYACWLVYMLFSLLVVS
jgi:hypothetical protein